MSDGARHRIGKPLDERAARDRAAQVSVLGNPDILRVLSALASDIPVASIPAELSLSSAVIDEALRSLLITGLVRDDEGRVTPTVDAWVRFGRLLSSESLQTAPTAPAVAELPQGS